MTTKRLMTGARPLTAMMIALALLVLLFPTTSATAAEAVPVDFATTSSGAGQWLAYPDGTVRAFGDAQLYGSAAGTTLARPIVGIARTPNNQGYWLVGADGRVFAFGNAKYLGGATSATLAKPIVDIASSAMQQAYWLVGGDGRVFPFGATKYPLTAGKINADRPIVDMQLAPAETGYWMVGTDGGIAAFGSARFYGSATSVLGGEPAIAMTSTSSGAGYSVATASGKVAQLGSSGQVAQDARPIALHRSPATGSWGILSVGGSFLSLTAPPVTTTTTAPPVTTTTTAPPATTTTTTAPPATTTTTTPPTTVPSTSASRALGFYPLHPNNDGIEKFGALENWLGRDVDHMVQFGDGRSVSAFNNNLTGQLQESNLGRYDGNAPFRLTYSVPMAFGERYDGTDASRLGITGQWDMLINNTGGRREVYRAAAAKLAANGYDDAIIRLGWEFDNPSSRWHAGADPTRFKAAWRVVQGIFREVSPNFRFDYNYVRVAAKNPIIEQAYPGDAYVDIIGVDAYDSGYTGPGGVPAGQTSGWADPQKVWDLGQLPMLEAHAAFARAHGKPVSFPEWALSSGGISKVGKSGGDNPTYIRNMHAWFAKMAAPGGPGLAYHSYFQQSDSPDGAHGLENFPVSREVFKGLYGG